MRSLLAWTALSLAAGTGLLYLAAPLASADEGWYEVAGFSTYLDCFEAGTALQHNDSRVDQWSCAAYPDTRTWYQLEYHSTS
ncbi:hypothetical protein [Kitasatospora sp. NPDC004531]